MLEMRGFKGDRARKRAWATLTPVSAAQMAAGRGDETSDPFQPKRIDLRKLGGSRRTLQAAAPPGRFRAAPALRPAQPPPIRFGCRDPIDVPPRMSSIQNPLMSQNPITDITFRKLRPASECPVRPARRRLHALHADPGADAAGRAGRPRCRRPGADRHRQDRRVPGRGAEPPADASRRSPERKLTDPRAIIIAPTRELAIQIDKDFRRHRPRHRPHLRADLRRRRLRQAARSLRAGCDIIIATPGRLIDYLKQHVFSSQCDRGRRHRRSRPHVRPRLHQGHPLPAAAHAAARAAPVHAVLGDARAIACSSSPTST